eukprot:14332489-Alexandrium_andersonii.AAC.1
MHDDDRTVVGGPVDLPTEMQANVDRGVTTHAEAAHELEVGAFDLDWELQAALDQWLLVETA